MNCFILRLFWLYKLLLVSNLEKGCWAFLGRLTHSTGGSSRFVRGESICNSNYVQSETGIPENLDSCLIFSLPLGLFGECCSF